MTNKTPKELKEKYDMIPETMLYSIVGYRDHGHYQGSFGKALMSNDLVHAFANADTENINAMKQWAALLYNEMPMDSYGSKEIYEDWCKNGGLKGGKK